MPPRRTREPPADTPATQANKNAPGARARERMGAGTRERMGAGTRERMDAGARTRHEGAGPRAQAREAGPWVVGDRLGSFFAQNKILAGAAEVIRRQGVEATTIEDILVAAGVSRRTFYKAFANKEDVLVALHRELSELFLGAMRASMEPVTAPLDRIARCVDVYLLAAQRSGGLMLALQAEAMRPGKLAERRREALAGLARLMEEGARASGRAPPDPLLVTGLLTGLEAVVHTLMKEGRLGDADVARARAVMMRMAVGALAEPGDEVPPLPRDPATLARA